MDFYQIILKANGIIISEGHERDLTVLINSHRDAFKAMKKWLVHFDSTTNNSKPSDPPELKFSWENDYKPHAEESWSLLNLDHTLNILHSLIEIFVTISTKITPKSKNALLEVV
ncbi:hypothetical protein QHH11_06190 [Aphanizomenon sp. PH219]|nr:hypothetical protein [Aphanizomenon sp. PH219]